MAPPCVLQARQNHKTWIWSGGGAAAHVEVLAGEQQGHYLVLTNQRPCEENSFAARMRKELAQLPGSPQVEWTHSMTRRLQRLFRWGDVASTRNDVVRAAQAGNLRERKAIMPEAGDLQERKAIMPEAGEEILESEELSQLPALLSDVQFQWRQHPERPMPFFVIDQEKVHDEEKVIWIRQEIGSNATLPELCAKFIELFGDKLRGPVPQKALCLKLYAMYAPGSREAAWKKEGDLPPRDMVDFQRVWDTEAPNRCLECRKPLEGTAASFRDSSYCSDKCKRAGVVTTCARCTPEQKCLYCRSAPSRSAPLGKRKFDTSKLDEAIRQGEEQLKRMRQVLGHERRSVDPDHEPAWKRRRRS